MENLNAEEVVYSTEYFIESYFYLLDITKEINGFEEKNFKHDKRKHDYFLFLTAMCKAFNLESFEYFATCNFIQSNEVFNVYNQNMLIVRRTSYLIENLRPFTTPTHPIAKAEFEEIINLATGKKQKALDVVGKIINPDNRVLSRNELMEDFGLSENLFKNVTLNRGYF